ncbi:MAG TPA: ATP-binding protein, partial [Polyangiaceae bacterium]|nr:ATP-binding protein [Polyangiaceae bacterium]
RRLQVAQRMEAVGRLAGGIAHDFNNCLQVVVGHAKLLKDELELSSTGPAKEAIRSVIAAGQRAARLTEQLLAFSRRQVQRLAPIDLNQVVIGMDPMIRRLVGADVTLDVSLADDLGIVIADKAQLEQILINLVVNAREAMPRGGDLRIETRNAGAPRTFVCRTGDLSLLDERTERPAGDYVLLAVTDTGCGMAGETLARIFEPFYTTKSDGQGTGLGLSTVYGIVRQSAGFIEVDSAVGNGTSFRIHLPRSAQRVDPRAPALRAAPRRGTETVLLVDDEAMVRRVVCRILQLHGFRVLQAGSGNEALLAAERYPHQIHLLLTDLVMPKMGGEQLAEQLRRIRPDLRILYMSGYTEQRVGETLPLAGDVGFIPKPFSPDRLVAAVCSVLDYERPS